MTIATGFTLHGILAASDASTAIARLGDHGHLDVAMIDAGPLSAIVSVVAGATTAAHVTPETEKSESDKAAALALRHHAVLTAIIGVTDIVPVRLGSLFSTQDAVSDLMTREQARFASELMRLKGCVEMGFRVSIPDTMGFAAKSYASPQAEQGQSYLRKQAAARMSSNSEQQGHATATHAAIEAFIPHAIDIIPRSARPRKGERRVLSDIAVLIKRDMVPTFQNLTRSFEAQLSARGLLVSILGPWAPYSFVHAETDGALSWAAH